LKRVYPCEASKKREHAVGVAGSDAEECSLKKARKWQKKRCSAALFWVAFGVATTARVKARPRETAALRQACEHPSVHMLE